jgi:DNA-binding transcriptional ArsR family regulator
MPESRDPRIRALRLRSRLLFGNSHRLEVGAYIARHKVVTIREIAAALGVADSLVRPNLKRLEEAGLLEAIPRSDRNQYFERADDDYFAVCRREVRRGRRQQPASVSS